MARYRFGVFELDSEAGELRRNGMLIKLAPQPLQILSFLVRRSGAVVTRDEIREEVWGAETFVDLDRNLNVSVAQIRAALGDDAETPRFVQTVPRRGYKFVGGAEEVGQRQPAPKPAARSRWWPAVAIAVAATLVVGALAWRSEPKGPGRILIAVLPFDDLTGDDSRRKLFRDGVMEEIITLLGGSPPARLGVIARTSSMRFDGKRVGVKEAAAQLGARYVVEGTIRETAGRVRLTARLINGDDQAQVWSGSFERDAAELPQLENEAASRITAGVLTTLFPGEPPESRVAHAPCPSSWEQYRNGRYMQQKGGREARERSIVFFEEALSRDRTCIDAAAALAESLLSLARTGSPNHTWFDRARVAAERALELDTANAEAMTVLANVLFWRDWKFADAERRFRRALELRPSYAAAHHDYAWLLVATGRAAEAVDALRRAIALDPLSARINIDAGWLYMQAHRFPDATRQARRALELEPGMKEASFCLFRGYVLQGDYRGALAAVGSPADASPQAAVERLVRASLEREKNANPFTTAQRYALLKENDKALDALEEALRRRDTSLVLLKSDPSFREFHQQVRFQALVQGVGLP